MGSAHSLPIGVPRAIFAESHGVAPVWAYMHANFDDFEDGRILVVRCEKAQAPVYVKDGNGERFYVRTGPSTTELPVGSAMKYISHRFG